MRERSTPLGHTARVTVSLILAHCPALTVRAHLHTSRARSGLSTARVYVYTHARARRCTTGNATHLAKRCDELQRANCGSPHRLGSTRRSDDNLTRWRQGERERAAPRRALVEARSTSRVNGSRRCRRGDGDRERKREGSGAPRLCVGTSARMCEGVEYGRVYLASRE